MPTMAGIPLQFMIQLMQFVMYFHTGCINYDVLSFKHVCSRIFFKLLGEISEYPDPDNDNEPCCLSTYLTFYRASLFSFVIDYYGTINWIYYRMSHGRTM